MFGRSCIVAMLASLFIFLLCGTVFAAASDADIIVKIAEQYHAKGEAWASVLQGYAFQLFRYLLIFETGWFGVKMALRREEIASIFGEFCIMMTFAGFMFSVITHYPEWTQNIIRGLSKISTELGAPPITDSPFKVGLNLVGTILSKLSVWEPANSIGLLLAAFAIVICFGLITARVLLVLCESYVALNASIILLGFGGSSIFKDYAINTMRYAFSVAFKLFVMQLILGVGISFIEGFNFDTVTFETIFITIGASIVLLALINSVPETVAGIINGSHVGGGVGLGSAVKSLQSAIKNASPVQFGVQNTGGASNAASSIQRVKDAAGAYHTPQTMAKPPSGQPPMMRTAMQERLQHGGNLQNK